MSVLEFSNTSRCPRELTAYACHAVKVFIEVGSIDKLAKRMNLNWSAAQHVISRARKVLGCKHNFDLVRWAVRSGLMTTDL